MTTRTLGPRDLDPRTLRVVQRWLDKRLKRQRRDVGYHAGAHGALRELEELALNIKALERDMRARLRRRQR